MKNTNNNNNINHANSLNEEKNNIQSEEVIIDKNFDDFIKNEIDMNFSPDELVKSRVKNTIKFHSYSPTTKKKGKVSRVLAASISGILIISAIGAIKVVGSDFFSTTKEVHSGMLTVYEEKLNVDPNELQYTFSEKLRGKVFDYTGKPLDRVSYADSQKGLFDSNGNRIYSIDEKNGTYVLERDKYADDKNYIAYFSNLSEAKKHLSFKPRLPQGFEIVKVGLYKDDGGKLGDDSLEVTLKKGDDIIWIQERVAIKENAYETSAELVEQVKIKGEPAILSDNSRIDWQHDDLFIGIHSDSINYQGKSLVNLAASIK